ncbi:MAG TPA: ester cyclase [Gemmatimonadales bacterium]|nr:ester cyclase [Gemmatimonadales bacterium]
MADSPRTAGGRLDDTAGRLESVAMQAIQDVWTRGNLALADAIYTPSFVNHDPNQPEVPPGPAGVKQTIAMWRSIFPDLALMPDEIFAAPGDRVVVRFTASGTHQGQFRTIAPTHRKIYAEGMVLFRFDAHAHITEAWTAWDALGMMSQMGARMEDATLVRMRQ